MKPFFAFVVIIVLFGLTSHIVASIGSVSFSDIWDYPDHAGWWRLLADDPRVTHSLLEMLIGLLKIVGIILLTVVWLFVSVLGYIGVLLASFYVLPFAVGGIVMMLPEPSPPRVSHGGHGGSHGKHGGGHKKAH